MRRKIATRMSPPIAALHASLERVLAERRRDVGAVERLELDRQRARLEHERDVLRLLERVEALDLRAPAADAAREARVGEVDLREGLDLAVEDDREVLRLLAQLAADPLVARDPLELVRARARELHGHDRPPGVSRARVEVRAGARELEILARHLRDVRRVVLEEVVLGAIGRDAGAARRRGRRPRPRRR